MPKLMNPLAAGFRLEGTNGEAVVLVHGFTGVPAHFRPLGGFLNERGYTVVAPRLAGHGTSVADLATTGPDDWIASARSAADEVADHDRIHLAGLSMGGLISILLARPIAAATVTTINSPMIVRDKRLYSAPVVRYFVREVSWPEPDAPDLEEDMLPYWIPYPGFPTKGAAGLLSIGGRALLAARQVEVPALVIQSRTDETVDPRSAAILATVLGKETRLVWLEDSIHVAVLDRTRHEIARILLEHIATGDSP
jgi:carboxylesterase